MTASKSLPNSTAKTLWAINHKRIQAALHGIYWSSNNFHVFVLNCKRINF